jgi:light-independent protochlorophyllide reductase subunit B
VEGQLRWSKEALQELGKIPGFVRGKIKRNTEKFAREKNLLEIKLETMYEAKETVGA